MRTHPKYGCIPDRADHRDFIAQLPMDRPKLPSAIDNTSLFPPVWDQGELGSCTAFGSLAVCAISERHDAVISSQVEDPSFLYTYWNTRSLEGTIAYDSGAEIRDAIKAIATWGVAPAADWPYDISLFAQKPPAKSYSDGATQRALIYARVPQNLYAIKYILSKGYGVAIGFSVYESFESMEVSITGMIPMPEHGEALLGGHCTALAGYRDDIQCFIMRNSWGSSWANNGYAMMPYRYLTDPSLSQDFWSISHVS